MNKLDEDLDDSSLFYKSALQRHKNINSQHSKQLKLTFYQLSNKTNQSNDCKEVESNLFKKKTKVQVTNNDGCNLNESKSSYFQTKISINSCPLCLKSFNNDSAYSAHMKQCAKTHQMTTQQLLKALELQKKQIQERRDLGLCSQVVPMPKKSTTKKSSKNDKESYDLELGLALSKSLVTCEKRPTSPEEVQQTTLEGFGFKSNITTSNKKRHDIEKKSVLKERTIEERQKIIVEKVAVVLLDEDVQQRDLKTEKLNQNSSFQSHQVPQLWGLGENDENCEWYVNEIKPLILLKEENTGGNSKSAISDDIKSEISKLNLPRRDIYKDWKKMINNDFKSDWVGKTKDGRNIYLHSLVLFTRCPEIFEKDCKSIFQKFNLSTIIILLEYLYCGTLDGLIRSEISNVFDLVVELKFNELINVLNQLKNDLLGSSNDILNASSELRNMENNGIGGIAHEITVKENKLISVEERDLFTEDIVDLTQSSIKQIQEVNENLSENESNTEKSYWSFIQHQKEKENALISEKNKETKTIENQKEERLLISNDYDREVEKEKNLISITDLNKFNDLSKKSDDSTTGDVIGEFLNTSAKMNNNDCIVISSGSESKTEENSLKSQKGHSNTPSSIGMEIPHFDIYDDFHCFSEEPLSPVGLHSQSLLMGDVSAESLKLSNPAQKDVRHSDNYFQEEMKETIGYCSTPISVRRVSKIKSSQKNSKVRSNRRRISNLSASRIVRKSLGLRHKVRSSKLSSSKKSIVGRRSNCNTKQFAKALTNSILNELSRSSVINSSPLREKNFVEITPINYGEEFGESVTPSPNYSNMGGSMLKEQLTKYGLKKNLAKSKAKKILNYIYEELHPFYNVKTKKIVKILHSQMPKAKQKSKSEACRSNNAKIAKNKNEASRKKKEVRKKTKDRLNFSKASEVLTDTTILSFERSINHDSDGSEFDDLSETLTQSIPNDPVDLPSVFDAFIRDNPEYHQKILLYEPIWLEELQKKLKETFKKQFKLCDIMDFLDQNCITFRSATQAKKLKRRNEKKENSKKKKRRLE